MSMSPAQFRLMSITFALLSLAPFLMCLAHDAYYLDNHGSRVVHGSGMALFLGWFVVGSGIVAWLANPVMLFGWVSLVTGRPMPAALAGGLALALMLSFLVVRQVPIDEAPNHAAVVAYGTGYWLWLTSAALLLAGGTVVGFLGRGATSVSG